MTSTTFWHVWRELGDGVFVRRHRALDVNAGLVLGERRALVVDTRGCEREGAELLAAVRGMTDLPLTVLCTHAHFDHCFGNVSFATPGTQIWGHDGCRTDLERRGEEQRRDMVEWLRQCGDEDLAADVERVRLVAPTHTFTTSTTVDLGGRTVLLEHPGRGHTDHDAVAHVPDAGVTFAGDLVEQGAPPSFDDAYPFDWPVTLDRLLTAFPGRIVVPGHGDVVDPDFVARQRDDIAEVATVARDLPADVTDEELERAANRLTVGGPAGYAGLRRARAHLTAAH